MARRNHGADTYNTQLKAKRKGIVIGWIGDRKHLARKSDHNPKLLNGDQVVNALDPMIGNGYTRAEALADITAIVESRDPRVSYIIFDGRILSGNGGTLPWKWRDYDGSDPHTNHWHMSVTDAADKNTRPWAMAGDAPAKPATSTKPAPVATLKEGSKGAAVEKLQKVLNAKYGAKLKVDGDFGPATEAALKIAQRKLGIAADGIAGPVSRAKLGV